MKIFTYILFIINSYVLVKIANLFGVIVDNLTNSNFIEFRENIISMSIYGLLSLVLPVISYKIAFKLSNKEMIKLKDNKFSSEFKNFASGFDLIDYTQNLDLFYSGQLMNKYNFANIVSVFVFTSISIIKIDIRLFIIAFLCSTIPLIIPIVTQKTLLKRSQNFIKASDTYAKFIEDKLSGKSELLRYNGISWIKNLHNNLSKDHENKRESFKFLNILNNILSEGISSISQIAILFFGGFFVIKSIISVGEVITLLQLMNYLASPVVAIISLYNNYLSSIPVKNRLIESSNVAEVENFNINIDDDQNIALELKDLTFSYGDKVVINNVNYKFLKSKSYLITGKSGSGKSTLLNLISGELKPDRGQITVFGKDINDMYKSEIYSVMSYVSQKAHIFENSVKDNILLGKNEAESRADNLIGTLELNLKLEDLISKERKVSGGEAVRIAVGRALIDPKDIIILDEHTSGLNEDLAFLVTKEILNLNKTVLCVSHTQSKDIIKLFDEHIKLEDINN